MTGIDVMGLDKVASIADASEILIASLNRYTPDPDLVRLSAGCAGASCAMMHSGAACPTRHTKPQTSPAPPLSQRLQMVILKPKPYTQNY